MARVAKMEARLAKIEMNELTLATRFKTTNDLKIRLHTN